MEKMGEPRKRRQDASNFDSRKKPLQSGDQVVKFLIVYTRNLGDSKIIGD